MDIRDSKITERLDLPDGSRMVLYDPMAPFERYPLEERARNIFLIDANDRVVWRISSDFDEEGGPFTGIGYDGDISKALRWDGCSYMIDLLSGKAVRGDLER